MNQQTAMFEPLPPVGKAPVPFASAPRSAGKRPIIPVPADAPAMCFRHPKHGEPTSKWPYHDADGALVGYVCRWDFVNAAGKPDKSILPVTYCAMPDGKQRWASAGVPDPRPLLDLPEIIRRTDAPILIVEGEKTRDAAAELFSDMVVTTPMHGAKSPKKTDFSVCDGRTVVIATDNDAAGKEFGAAVYALARAAGATNVYHLPPERLGCWVWEGGERRPRGEPIPEAWDLADAVKEGWTAPRVGEMQRDPGFLVPFAVSDAKARDDKAKASGRPKPTRDWPFRLTEHGVERQIERDDKRSGKVTKEWRWFCSPLEVAMMIRDADGQQWGRLLRITDSDGKVHFWAMPMSATAGGGEEYRRELAGLGLILAPGILPRNWLQEYIATAKPTARARCVSRIGWHGTTFVLPDATFGDTGGEEVLLQTPSRRKSLFRTSGNLSDWQDNVAAYGRGNSRLMLAISTALAGPLLHLTGTESGGLHFRGGSSMGKSTALLIAGSVWGGGGIKGNLVPWRATDNGLEAVAAEHCDACLCLDEISEVDAKALGPAAYMLGNGSGKIRAGRGGEARSAAEWRIIFLSSGEISLADKLAEDGRGRAIAAGQEVRVVDLPADAKAGFGLFEDLHEFSDSGAFARHLNINALKFYGTAGRAFLERVAAEPLEIGTQATRFRDAFVMDHCPSGADGQVSRVAGRFGLIAAAGEIAVTAGIVPWPQGAATQAAATCLGAWLKVRGGIGASEIRDHIARVRAFIGLHGNSRFETPWEPDNSTRTDLRVNNRVGFRRRSIVGETGWDYYILPEAWVGEVCPGFDATAVATHLISRGLMTGTSDRVNVTIAVPGHSDKARLYHVKPCILDGGDLA